MIHNLFRVLVILVVLLSAAGCSDKSEKPPSADLIAVRVMQPVIKDMQNSLSYVGTVHAKREVRVIAQVQGTVTSLPVPEGASVTKGDLIVEIDVPDLRANAERLQAERDYWCRRYESDQRLVEAEALPQEQAEASLRACRSARAALAEVDAKLAKARELASESGAMLSWLVETGQHVMPGQALLLLGYDSPELHVEVVEEDLFQGIRIGLQAVVYDWRGNPADAEVSDIAPAASGPGRTFTVKTGLPESRDGSTARTGASRRVDFILKSSRESMAVPVEALSRANGETHIFLIRDDKAHRQPVTPGIEQDGFIAVEFAWNGEDRVAVSNLGSLVDGVAVFPVEVERVYR